MIPVGAVSVDLILSLLILNRHIILEREQESYILEKLSVYNVLGQIVCC